MSSRALAIVALAIVLMAGAWARLTHLGEKEFWTDELNHHYAALALAKGHGPLLPSGESYVRGLPFTQAVSVTQRLVGDPELAARLPSALLGILGLALLAGIAWHIAGPWAAVWATALLAVYPEAIDQSRSARFYTYQLDLGLLGLVGGWLATRPRDVLRPASSSDGLPHRWAWTLLAGTALYFAYRIQPTTLTAILALGAWFAMVAIHALVRDGVTAFARSVPVQVCAAALVLGLVLWLAGIAQPTLAMWWGRTQWVATWVGEEMRTPTFYLGELKRTLGWVLAFLPVSALVAYRANPPLTLFLLTWLLVPLTLHSLLLEWKGARYFLLPLPALLILTGMAAQELFGALRAQVERYLDERSVPLARALTVSGLAGTGLWLVVNLPAFHDFQALRHGRVENIGWRAAGEVLRAHPRAESVPWASTDPLMSLHFWGRVDAGVQPGLLDYAVKAAAHHPVPRIRPDNDELPRDFYSGVPIATRPGTIRSAYASAGALIVGVDTIFDTFLTPELRATLEREGQELCAGRCGRIRLYYWRFDGGS